MIAEQLEDPVIECSTLLTEVLAPLGRVYAEALLSGPPDQRLTLAQYRILSYLDERDHLSSELARYLAVTPSSITTTVDVLVSRGLAERIAAPNDRRCIRVRATPAGLACLERARARMVARAGDVVRRLESRDRQRLVEGLTALRAALADGMNGRPAERTGRRG